ncbi:hypothetical protein BC937DRAFT_92416 [Endogone sp. FLAS-F59071]|nr:hypothetical protein BC937DRAFT_92416 [Endogone sp. FLAS-F59071]|eukprot:RUS15464.1 hypothetical protein BC937DRAFT_92416 [Endogone sp. FLAS-F59071]
MSDTFMTDSTSAPPSHPSSTPHTPVHSMDTRDDLNNSSSSTSVRANPLPFPIHPDDAKDKVFTAILKALARMDNKPSSPKELANTIIKYKYATLGGATPYATVSSRISQHFKRAAEHNPPRPPLLAKHVDTVHPRRTQYSVADVTAPSSETSEPAPAPASRGRGRGRRGGHTRGASSSSTSPARRMDLVVRPALAHMRTGSDQSENDMEEDVEGEEEEEEMMGGTLADASPTAQAVKTRTVTKKRKRTYATPRASPNRVKSKHVSTGFDSKRRRMGGEEGEEEGESSEKASGSDLEADDESYMDDEETDTDEEMGKDAGHLDRKRVALPLAAKDILNAAPAVATPAMNISVPPPQLPPPSSSLSSSSSPSEATSYNGSSSTYSVGPDKGKRLATAATIAQPAAIPIIMPPTLEDQSDDESEADYSDYHEEMLKGDLNIDDDIPISTSSSMAPTLPVTKQFDPKTPSSSSSSSSAGLKTMAPPSAGGLSSNTPTSTPASSLTAQSPRLRRTPTSLSSNSTAGNLAAGNLTDDIWLPYTFDQDFDTVFLGSDDVNLGPLDIADPQSISVSELDNYFNSGSSSGGSGTPPHLPNRKPSPPGSSSRYKLSNSGAPSQTKPSSLQRALFAGKGEEEEDTGGNGLNRSGSESSDIAFSKGSTNIYGPGTEITAHVLSSSAFDEGQAERGEAVKEDAKEDVKEDATTNADADAVVPTQAGSPAAAGGSDDGRASSHGTERGEDGSATDAVTPKEGVQGVQGVNPGTEEHTRKSKDDDVVPMDVDDQHQEENKASATTTKNDQLRRDGKALSVSSTTMETGRTLRQRRGSRRLSRDEGDTASTASSASSSVLPSAISSRRSSIAGPASHTTSATSPAQIYERIYSLMRVYELISSDTDTRILRFIDTTDGSSNNIAKRTRHGEAKSRRSSHHYYLDAGYVNATQLRKAAKVVMGNGKFDAAKEKGGTVIMLTHGPMECRGAWVPLYRARELVKEYHIEHFSGLKQLLSDMPLKQDYSSSGASDGGESPSDKKNTRDGDPEQGQSSNDDSAPEAPSEDEGGSRGASNDVDARQHALKKEAKPVDAAQHAPEKKVKPIDTVLATQSLELLAAVAEADAMSMTSPLSASSQSTSTPIPLFNTHLTMASVLSRRAPTMPPSPNFEMDHDSYVKYEVEDEGFGSDDGKQLKGTINSMVDTASQGVSAMTISATAMAILAPALNCAKSAALSLSPLAISTAMANHTPVTPAPSPSPELGDALFQLSIQLPEFGMSKEASPSSTPTMTAPPSPIMKADAIFIGMTGEKQPIIISTSKPTTPPVYITVIDNIAVYVMLLTKATGFDKDYRLMRRVDTGYVNGTTLLMAGGIETESERSIVFSLEVGRMRVRKQSSELFGTWIPLRRAMALATSCSLRHKLGPFLDEDLDTHFPSPLPISLPMSHKSDLQALTLAALRNPTPPPTCGGYFSHPLGPAAPIPQSGANTYLQQLLLNLPQRSVKYGNPPLKAPMLGCFDEDSRDDLLFRRKEISIVSSQPAVPLGSTRLSKSPTPPSSTCVSTPPPHDLPTPENEGLSSHESEIDIVNNESDDNTDTDEDVEEVREHMKKIRAAAVDAMQNGGTDLNEITSVATSAETLDEDYDIDPVDWNREVVMPDGRRFAIKPHAGSESNGLGDDDREDRDLETAQRATMEMTTGQRRRSATKWTGKNGICKMGLSRKIVGSNSQRQGRRAQVELTVLAASMPAAMRTEEDEDEEIDIGGSDRDDDLR